MSTVLESIIVGVREDLAVRKRNKPNLESEVKSARPVTDAHKALGTSGMSIIAEVKRSSPSKGELATISDPAKLAAEYEESGAAIVSVLTEERRFKGSIKDFKNVQIGRAHV